MGAQDISSDQNNQLHTGGSEKFGLNEIQQRAVDEVKNHILSGSNVLLQSPTGSGKTRMSIHLLRWAKEGVFYVNRKSLVMQSSKAFTEAGVWHGIRAAEYEDKFDYYAPVQIASADTERNRVYGKNAQWSRHESNVIIVDEAHIQKGEKMKQIIDDHIRSGASVVLLSATPVGLRNMVKNCALVIGGTLGEFRASGLLVMGKVFGIETPDMSKVKRQVTGEYVLDDKIKRIYTQSIVGSVIENYRKLSNGSPCMLYAPGKKESRFFCEKFNAAGIRWCHVDATEAYFDGNRYRLGRKLWQDILGEYSDGKFAGISSRFKLREGVDVPKTGHIILATPIGSISSYLQTIGRGLRAYPGKTECIIADHGGNYLLHGSPNRDRDWELLSTLSPNVASSQHKDAIRNREEKEPICCEFCGMERLMGIKCPNCGKCSSVSSRRVIQADGSLKIKKGEMIPKKRVLRRRNTQRLWDNMYYAFKHKQVRRTFSQMEAFFAKEHGYWPPRDSRNMPKTRVGWYTHVYQVGKEDLN